MSGLVLFGGAFDPPHTSHVRVARRALEQLPADTLWVLPSGDHPHKPRLTATADQRLAMCEIAFDGIEGIEVRDMELRRDGPSYSVDTVRAVHAADPERPLFWLVGADNLPKLHTWHRFHELLALCTVATFPRAGSRTQRALLERLPLTTTELDRLMGAVLEGEADGVSATAAREALGRGDPSIPDLDPGVLAFIREHGLYGPAAEGTR